MIRSCSCLVLAAVFQMVCGQAVNPGRPPQSPLHGFQRQTMAVPKHCLAPPPGVDLHKCCPLPQIFPDEDMARCGIEKITKERPKSPTNSKGPCHDSMCLLQNANLLLANQSVDYEKLRAFVDKWADINPNFTEAIQGAKKVCAHDGGPSGPPVCEPDRVFICLTSNVLWNCKLQDLGGTSGCQILKEHMDECRPFYYTQSEEELLRARKQL